MYGSNRTPNFFRGGLGGDKIVDKVPGSEALNGVDPESGNRHFECFKEDTHGGSTLGGSTEGSLTRTSTMAFDEKQAMAAYSKET